MRKKIKKFWEIFQKDMNDLHDLEKVNICRIAAWIIILLFTSKMVGNLLGLLYCVIYFIVELLKMTL